MLKFTEKEVRDHIRRYGIERAGDTLKGVATVSYTHLRLYTGSLAANRECYRTPTTVGA